MTGNTTAPSRAAIALAVVGLILAVAAAPIRAADEPAADYKSAYRVINVHTHSGSPTEEAVQAILPVLDRTGIERIVILDGGSPAGSLPAWLELRKKYPDRLSIFLKLSFARLAEPTFFADIVRELDEAAQGGIAGVKVWKDLGMSVRDTSGRLLKADDERLDPFFRRCGELGLPVLIHQADPKEYWYPLTYNSLHYGQRNEKDQFYNDPEMPTWEELIARRDHILEKHPQTNFIGAHLGSMSFDLAALEATLRKYPNFSVDCAARQRIIGRLNPEAVRDFFVNNQDRILFGTDGILLFAGRKPSAVGQHPALSQRRSRLDAGRSGQPHGRPGLATARGRRARPIPAVLRDRPAEPLGPDGARAARGSSFRVSSSPRKCWKSSTTPTPSA